MTEDLQSAIRCPDCLGQLQWSAETITCAPCRKDYPRTEGVVRFVGQNDSFYEGAYRRQVHYLPGRNWIKNLAFFELVQSGVFGRIRAALPKKGRVLDLGCAGGVAWLGSRAETIGIDLSFSSLATTTPIYAAALQASVIRIPLADSSCDLVYGSYFFEHLDEDTKKKCLEQVARVLRPGGSIVLQFDTLSNNFLTRFARRDAEAFKKAFVDNDGHVGLEPLSVNISKIESAGLRVDRVLKFGTTPLQYSATYQWLDAAYGANHRWVRACGAITRRISRSPLNLPFEFAITTFDRMLNPFSSVDAATRAIVVARRP